MGDLRTPFRPEFDLLESSSGPSSSSNTTPSSPPTTETHTTYDGASTITIDKNEYRTLEVTCGIFANLVLSAVPSPFSESTLLPTPIFYVKNNIYKTYGPSVTLTDKTRDGDTLGFVQLRWARSDLFTIGPTLSLARWHRLMRISSLSHSRFDFEFNFGPTGGGRRKFIWRRKYPSIFHDQPDLELHEIVGWSVWGAWGYESFEVLANYRGMRSGRHNRPGMLKIKRGVVGGQEEGYQDCRDKGDEPWGEWEKVVVLTAMAILEAARRRSIRKAPDPKLSELSP
jgi:hypothetical protein